MKRRVLNLMTVLSLLLCVATLAMWVLSYWRSNYVSYVRLTPRGEIVRALDLYCGTGRGKAIASLTDHGFKLSPGESVAQLAKGWGFESHEPEDPFRALGTGWSGFGFESLRLDADMLNTGAYRSVSVGFPMWLPVAFLALLPVVRACRRLRRVRRLGLCPACGYDLRATPDRCPECGAAAVSLRRHRP